jgi:hypothetical protein
MTYFYRKGLTGAGICGTIEKKIKRKSRSLLLGWTGFPSTTHKRTSMNELTNAERETHLNLVADNRGTWYVYSDDPVMIRRLDKIATATKVTATGKHYELSKGQVILRKEPKKREYTEEQMAELRERGRKLQTIRSKWVLENQNKN